MCKEPGKQMTKLVFASTNRILHTTHYHAFFPPDLIFYSFWEHGQIFVAIKEVQHTIIIYHSLC